MGSISNISTNFEKTKFFREQDEIKLKYLGEKTDINDKKFNTWFYNNVSYFDIVQPNENATKTIQTLDNHFLNAGDRIDILDKDTKDIVFSDVEVSSVNSVNQFDYIGIGISSRLTPAGTFSIKKRLKFTSSNLNLGFLVSDIQNTFVDKDDNTYVAFSGYPSDSSIQSTDRSVTFQSNNVSDNGISGIATGTYFVKVVDPNTIKLALNAQNLYLDNTVSITGTTNTDVHKITPSIPVGDVITKLQNQNNFRRILKNPENNQENKNITGPIGLSLNGIEYHSPISDDSVFYGQIDNIVVLNKGNGYSAKNPPNVSINDSFGSSAVANVHVDEGQIEEIILTNKGFDYIGTPSVTISGGDGSGAELIIKLL
jgi:hypothetical protein